MVKAWAGRIALLLVAVAATLTVVELFLSDRVPGSSSDDFLGPPPDDVALPYAPIVGADVQFEGHYLKIPATGVRISKQGIRADRDYTIPKPPQITRIAALGDSFVFGSGVERGQTFVAQWEALQKDVEIINLGVPGFTSIHAVRWFEYLGVTMDVDAVVLFVSDNDFYDEGRERLKERRAQGDGWATERYVKTRLDRKAKALRSWKKDPKVVLDRLKTVFDRLDALPVPARVMLLFPHPLAKQIQALRPQIGIVADNKYMKEISGLQIHGDLHPNAGGHARLAALIHERLNSWVQSLTSSR
jgi:lysophospholipase L1-like esterase